MEEPSSTNPIPIQFYDWFIKPLLEIPLDNPDKNQLFREFMNKRLTIELDKSLKILKQNLDYLLVQKSKKQLFEYQAFTGNGMQSDNSQVSRRMGGKIE